MPADLPLPAGRPAGAGRGPAGAGRPPKGADAGELALLGRIEARSPTAPTPCRALGVEGHRAAAGARGCKDLAHVSAVVDVVTAAIHAALVEGPRDAAGRTGESEVRRLQGAFAARLRHVGRACPASERGRVVLPIGNAPVTPGRPWPRPWRITRTRGWSGCRATGHSSR